MLLIRCQPGPRLVEGDRRIMAARSRGCATLTCCACARRCGAEIQAQIVECVGSFQAVALLLGRAGGSVVIHGVLASGAAAATACEKRGDAVGKRREM